MSVKSQIQMRVNTDSRIMWKIRKTPARPEQLFCNAQGFEQPAEPDKSPDARMRRIFPNVVYIKHFRRAKIQQKNGEAR